MRSHKQTAHLNRPERPPRRASLLTLALLVAIAAVGCSKDKESGPAVTGATLAAHPAGCDPSIGKEERIKAMLAVHAHAYAKVNALDGYTPASLGVLSLDAAKTILLKDCDPLAPARRRRAAAKLAAYGKSEEPFLSTWKALLIDPVLIDKFMGAIHVSIASFELESQLFNLASALMGSCESVTNAKFEGPGLDNGVVSWEVSYETTANQDWLWPRLDPQNWDRCSPFFTETRYTTEFPTRQFSCPGPGSSPAENNVKTPGDVYDATLFEFFQCPACETDAQNLLAISARSGASCASGSNPCDVAGWNTTPAYQVCYSLPCDAAKKTLCGNPPSGKPECCGEALYFCTGNPAVHQDLIMDQGDLTVCDPSSPTTTTTAPTGVQRKVIARKNIKFASGWTNLAAYVLYYLGQKETTESTIDLACCQL